MENGNFKFFQHRQCEYFPCHDAADTTEFNCIFCFCPLYALGEGCGGSFVFNDDGAKDCSSCTIPHSPDGYEYVMARFEMIKEMAGRKDG